MDEALFLSDWVAVLSPRPGRIRAEIAVDLPRPRDRDVLTTPEFMRLKKEALDRLSAERMDQNQVLGPALTGPAGR